MITHRTYGLSGPTGDFLFGITPDWALSIVCDNADPKTIVSGSACDKFLRTQAALYPPPPMPVAPGVPESLPSNPVDRTQAEAAVQGVVDTRAVAQSQQTQDFFNSVVAGLDTYDAQQSAGNLNALLFWGLAAVGVVWIVKR